MTRKEEQRYNLLFKITMTLNVLCLIGMGYFIGYAVGVGLL